MKYFIEKTFKSTVLILMELELDEKYKIEIEHIHTNFDKGHFEEAMMYLNILQESIISDLEK